MTLHPEISLFYNNYCNCLEVCVLFRYRRVSFVSTGAEDSAAGATGGGWQQPQIPPAGSDLQPQIPQTHFDQHPQFPVNPPAQPPALPPQPSFTQPTPVAAAGAGTNSTFFDEL